MFSLDLIRTHRPTTKQPGRSRFRAGPVRVRAGPILSEEILPIGGCPLFAIDVNRAIAKRYAEIARTLRPKGLLIGGNDIWIAATAVHYDQPLVTRNLEHFARVPDIRLVSY